MQPTIFTLEPADRQSSSSNWKFTLHLRIIIPIWLFSCNKFSFRYARFYNAYFMKQNYIFKTQFLKIFINFKLPNQPKLQIVLCDLYKMTFAFSSSYSKKVHIIIRSSREKVRQKEAQIRDVNCPHVFFFRLLLLFCFCSWAKWGQILYKVAFKVLVCTSIISWNMHGKIWCEIISISRRNWRR